MTPEAVLETAGRAKASEESGNTCNTGDVACEINDREERKL
jgi:hypothetical protein